MHKTGDFFLLNVFTGPEARGNSCCVLFVDDINATHRLHAIAQDMNQPATAFLLPLENGAYRVRWFAPESEIDLCGHGALACTHVLLEDGVKDSVSLIYGEGQLEGRREGTKVSISGKPIEASQAAVPDWLIKGFGAGVKGYFPSSNKHIVLFDDPEAVRSMQPNWGPLLDSGVFSFAVTAPSNAVDFVSRVFLPSLAKKEDQATGSAHMVLAPFWAPRLGKTELNAHQVSARGGRVLCRLKDDEVELLAECTPFGQGTMQDCP